MIVMVVGWVGVLSSRRREGQKEIPPLRCGMTNKEQATAKADPPPAAKDDN
jgi:hypothetical protein